MDFELTDDQEALRDGVRSLCQGRFPMEVVRGLENTGVDRKLWAELADTGVFALRVPEADGGVGLGTAEAVLVFEELGRALVPGPLVATHLAAGLPAFASDAVVTVVERPAAGDVARVEYLAAADAVVVLDVDGVTRIAAADVLAAATALPHTLDPLTPVHVVESLPAGERVGDAAEAARWRRDGHALVAGQLLGITLATTDLAVVDPKERRQFDKPIGSFQAVKHLCADMLVRAEVARAGVYGAAVTVDQPEVGDVERAVAGGKLLASLAAVENGKACIQVHGGMGFTWEVDAHLFLKRAWVLECHFGDDDDLAEAVAGQAFAGA